ncbi:MAG TPA: Stp1/IreP family PP2C-type Ser/Thr phosphatase [Anaeromyxobacteraceae bacterium]|nr:Stp1/IreP family PP2C-type Ser/Thr phosphatase [Anaeromyxobacteraceae bacterium]
MLPADYTLTALGRRGYCRAMLLAAIGITDVGRKRRHNEDAFLVMPEAGLFAVADGLGGHASGEVASRLAVETLAAAFDPAGPGPGPGATAHGVEDRLRSAIRDANQAIHDRSTGLAAVGGMGTTLVAAGLAGDGPVVLAHVGDSRAYLFRSGELRRLTEDHSLLQDFIREARPSVEEIEAFPHKHVIVRAVGMREAVEPEVARTDVEAGDLLLLCCDGLHGMIHDEEIADVLRREGPDVRRAGQALVDAANRAGGADNVTVVVVRVVEP